MSATRLILRITTTGLVVIQLAGCYAYGGPMIDTRHQPVPYLNIPEGHMPPPGECRIWHPGLEPGQQPPPGDCRDLMHAVPPGAVLIRG